MERDKELIYIATNTEGYLNIKGKSLEQRLQQTELSQEAIDEIKKEKGLKTIRDKGLALFGNIGEAISTVLNWNEEVNKDINEAKKALLIQQYFNKIDSQEQAIFMLKEFITNPQGNTLFNKILRMLDDSPPDEELLKHLSSVLKSIIIDGDFEELFSQHKYALSQIERLTPQALTIISDNDNWPPIKLGSYTSNGPKVTSDWNQEFTNAYCNSKGMTNQQSFKRVMHSIIELQRQGFVEAYLDEKGSASCKLTQVGSDIVTYLN